MANKLIILDTGPHHVAVFKPHNMTVIGGPGLARPTLLDLVRERFGSSIYPVHRLDRVTAGITLFARSIFAKHALDNAFKKRLVKKIYYAICEGQPNFKKTTLNASLTKVALTAKKGPQARQSISEDGQSAHTEVRVLKILPNNLCLLEALPITGRMHQIRIHLAHLGLPILGDKLYGAKITCAPHTIALCAVKLQAPLPKGGRITIDATQYFEPNSYLPPTSTRLF